MLLFPAGGPVASLFWVLARVYLLVLVNQPVVFVTTQSPGKFWTVGLDRKTYGRSWPTIQRMTAYLVKLLHVARCLIEPDACEYVEMTGDTGRNTNMSNGLFFCCCSRR